MILPLILYVLFSSTFIFAKLLFNYAPPIFITGFRMVLAGIVLLVYQYFKAPDEITVSKKNITPLLVLIFFNIYATNVLEYWGLQYMTTAKACFLYNFSPFIAAPISYVLFNEKLSLTKFFALILGFLGFVPLLLTGSAQEDKFGDIAFLSLPELALLGAATATAYGWIGMKQLMHQGYSPVTANSISMIIGGILALLTSLYVEPWNPSPVSSWYYFMLWIIPFTLISNIICYNLYGYLLKFYSATLMIFLGFSSPFFTALFGWMILGETVSWHFFVSAIIVFAALYLYYLQEIRQGTLHKPQ